MFTVYCYNVGGRKRNRYFRSWNKAKAELLKELFPLKDKGWKVVKLTNEYNATKGWYEFEYLLLTTNGESASLSLYDAYFEDEE